MNKVEKIIEKIKKNDRKIEGISYENSRLENILFKCVFEGLTEEIF